MCYNVINEQGMTETPVNDSSGMQQIAMAENGTHKYKEDEEMNSIERFFGYS